MNYFANYEYGWLIHKEKIKLNLILIIDQFDFRVCLLILILKHLKLHVKDKFTVCRIYIELWEPTFHLIQAANHPSNQHANNRATGNQAYWTGNPLEQAF